MKWKLGATVRFDRATDANCGVADLLYEPNVSAGSAGTVVFTAPDFIRVRLESAPLEQTVVTLWRPGVLSSAFTNTWDALKLAT